jgi:undecaprenyl-diphosphatase
MSAGLENILEAVVIGLIQALTEFLPVSSSGHLVIAKTLLGVEEVGITLEIVTHFATALAIIIFLRRRLREILYNLWKHVACGCRSEVEAERRDSLLVLYVIVATIPAGIVGVLLRDYFDAMFQDARTTAAMLIVTGVFVLLAGRLARSRLSLKLPQAIVIGAAQAFAVIPGISRSGSTVGAGLLAGVRREEAFEFSLLLSLPAILGGSVVELLGGRMGGDPWVILAAGVPAFLMGLVAIRILFRAVVRNWFHAFAYYLIPLGIVLLVFL